MSTKEPIQIFDKPWAVEGKVSYRYAKGLGGYVMLGANNHFDALQAANSHLKPMTAVSLDKLAIYIGGVYVPATEENNPKGR